MELDPHVMYAIAFIAAAVMVALIGATLDA
jgi:hypothetical protein